MRTVCETDLCNGCAACASICAKNAIQLVDSIEYFNAVIDDSRCVNCGACSNVCPRISQRYVFRKPTEWLQGWTKDDATRGASASGGAASELMKSFIANNGYVCSCAFREGEFSYFITNKVEEIKLFAGSKYVKSNPQFVYREVKKLINAGNSVLFIGLPCHVAAMKNYIGRSKNQDLLYTADLICHGSPSVKVLKKYLADYGHDLEKLEDIKFREKSDFRLGSNYKPIVKPGIADWYLYTFLKKISCSKNCYHCQYART